MEKLPPNAKSVFKGKIFEVWQWGQKMFDGSTSIFERISRPDAVIVIGTVKDKVMVLTQEQPDSVAPYTSMPGGRIEKGEDPLECAKREFMEETGYESSDWQLLSQDSPIHKVNYTIYIFVAGNCKKTSEPNLDPGEKIEVRWFSFDEFIALSDNHDFYYTTLVMILLRARLDENKMKELKDKLFK